MSISGILSGIVIISSGIFMISLGEMDDAPGAGLIGFALIILGIYMIINTKKEDKIEGIRKK